MKINQFNFIWRKGRNKLNSVVSVYTLLSGFRVNETFKWKLLSLIEIWPPLENYPLETVTGVKWDELVIFLWKWIPNYRWAETHLVVLMLFPLKSTWRWEIVTNFINKYFTIRLKRIQQYWSCVHSFFILSFSFINL